MTREHLEALEYEALVNNQVYVQNMLVPLWIIMINVVGTFRHFYSLYRYCVHLQATTSSDLGILYGSVDLDLDQWNYVKAL